MPDVERKGIQELIDSCLVKEPAAKPGHLQQRRRLGGQTAFGTYLLKAVWSPTGLLVLMFVAAVVTFIILVDAPGMNVRDALLAAGCAGLLAPMLAIAAIKLVDLLLRIAVPAIGVALAAGLIGLLGQMLFAD